jgi:hypothetical protein
MLDTRSIQRNRKRERPRDDRNPGNSAEAGEQAAEVC